MQITLSSQQSQILESLARQSDDLSIEDAIDMALVLLADEITSFNSEEAPEYLGWVEQTRLKIEEGVLAAAQGDVLQVSEVLARLHNKVEVARTQSA